MEYVWTGIGGKKIVFSELTGIEPIYDEKKWNSKTKIQKTHNCYAYMFDIIGTFDKKPQPGYASGYQRISNYELRDCDKIYERVKSDNPSLLKTTFDKKCPDGYRKAYFAIDDSTNSDYHFYRQNKDGTWSHKPGSTPVRRIDYNGNIIYNPETARRESSSYQYKKSCGFFCYDPTKTRISNKPT